MFRSQGPGPKDVVATNDDAFPRLGTIPIKVDPGRRGAHGRIQATLDPSRCGVAWILRSERCWWRAVVVAAKPRKRGFNTAMHMSSVAWLRWQRHGTPKRVHNWMSSPYTGVQLLSPLLSSAGSRFTAGHAGGRQQRSSVADGTLEHLTSRIKGVRKWKFVRAFVRTYARASSSSTANGGDDPLLFCSRC